MAALTHHDGRGMIQFPGLTGKRETLRLGRISRSKAERVRLHVEALLASRRTGSPLDEQTIRWVGSLPRGMRDKLIRVGLIRGEGMTVGEFAEQFLRRHRGSYKPATLIRLRQAVSSLTAYLGPDTPLNTVTRGHASDWRRHLLGEGYAEATVRKRCGDIRMIFGSALDYDLIPANPFDRVKCSAVATKHLRLIPAADCERVMAELADPQWRLLFALARWGGLRVPSEPARLTWGDVAWDAGRLLVQGKAETPRQLPLFPELVAPLQTVFDRARTGEEAVLPMLGPMKGAMLRKPLLQAINRAGVTPWPRLWHNLRASRENELMAVYPAHVVQAWIGHTAATARKHYLAVTEDHYAQATRAALDPPGALHMRCTDAAQGAMRTPRNPADDPGKRDET